MDELLAEAELARIVSSSELNEKRIERVSRRYRVSKETVFRRLLIAGRITPGAYRTAIERWRKVFAEMSPRKQAGAPPVHVTELSRVGRLFPRLVLQSYYQDKITGLSWPSI